MKAQELLSWKEKIENRAGLGKMLGIGNDQAPMTKGGLPSLSQKPNR